MAIKGHDTQDRNIGGCGKWMRGIVTIDEHGDINMKTHIYNHCVLKGFHGGIVALFFDAEGNLLYSTPLEIYGVGTGILFDASSDLWADAHYTVDPDIYNKTDKIDIWVGYTPRDNTIPIIINLVTGLRLLIYIWEAFSARTDEPAEGYDPDMDQLDLGDNNYALRSSATDLGQITEGNISS